jgi:CDGSH-type Zn-finger protein
MARFVKHEEKGPYQIKASSGEVFYVCGCGLSKNKPYCDGSHKRTLDEEGIFVYEGEKRIRIV